MSIHSDVIVVGSGASGVHAAYSLIEARHTVAMLDVGYEDTTYEPLIPDAPFQEVRRTDPSQHRYFLGDNFEGIFVDPNGAVPQVTPPRRFVFQNASVLTPTVSRGFEAFESLALGGLGGTWGAVCFPFLDNELAKCHLCPEEMRPYYEAIAQRIGISACRDDLEPLRGPLKAYLPPLEMDSNAERVFSRYQQRRHAFHRKRVYLGYSTMAVLTVSLNGRAANPYHDMDFWCNKSRSVYRPNLTLEELRRWKGFSYYRPYLVETFIEEPGGRVSVLTRSLETGRCEIFVARRLILAAGSLGTARIALRSLNQYDVPIPITCNPHSYVPCIRHRGLGKVSKDRRHSLAQLTIIYDPTGDREHLVQGQLYSYRSLLLFRLLKESSLPYREGVRIMRALSPSLVICVIQHEDYQSVDKHCVLRRKRNGERDFLEIVYHPSDEEAQRRQAYEKVIVRHLRKLGCWPIKVIHSSHGLSVHYASQFPTSRHDKPLTTEPSGRLRGTRSVYIADGAALAYLPAKGPTFTLMANAARVGKHVLSSL